MVHGPFHPDDQQVVGRRSPPPIFPFPNKIQIQRRTTDINQNIIKSVYADTVDFAKRTPRETGKSLFSWKDFSALLKFFIVFLFHDAPAMEGGDFHIGGGDETDYF